jgi:uncharacterized protein (DUF1778 family)
MVKGYVSVMANTRPKKLTARFSLVWAPSDLRMVCAAAKRAGEDVSEYVRRAVLERAQRDGRAVK